MKHNTITGEQAWQAELIREGSKLMRRNRWSAILTYSLGALLNALFLNINSIYDFYIIAIIVLIPAFVLIPMDFIPKKKSWFYIFNGYSIFFSMVISTTLSCIFYAQKDSFPAIQNTLWAFYPIIITFALLSFWDIKHSIICAVLAPLINLGSIAVSGSFAIFMNALSQWFFIFPIDVGMVLLISYRVSAFRNNFLITRELNRSKEELETVYEQITNSVKYAKRIQMAILPIEEKIKEILPNSFVLYKAKDIVSGDFYWLTNISEQLSSEQLSSNQLIHSKKLITDNCITEHRFLAVADCTGHGVPGAFMTLIGNILLNQIVNEHRIIEPAQILEELDKRLLLTLQQQAGKEKINDGMDISLIRIDQTEIVWASAKRPLIYFQNKEIHELKGSKFPIGGASFKEKHFEQHAIRFQKDDIFYLFTDGFVDQFSEKGEKMMIKRFRELLISIQNQNLEQQKHILEQEFEKWQGSARQLDDVLLIGLKF